MKNLKSLIYSRQHTLLQLTLSRSFSNRSPDLLQLENKNSIYKHEFLYGIHPVSLALSANRRTFKQVFYRKDLLPTNPRLVEILNGCKNHGVKCKGVSKSALDSINPGKPHQGICAEVTKLTSRPYNLTDEEVVLQSKAGSQLWLVLYNIHDPMNFGAILRTAYFLGVDRVLVPHDNSCSLTPTVSKASSGVMEFFEIYSVDVGNLLLSLKSADWNILGTGIDGSGSPRAVPSVSVEDCHAVGSSVLVLGNEGFGLPESIVECCSQLISIQPGRELHPGIDSMNVSAAASILIHSLTSKIKQKS